MTPSIHETLASTPFRMVRRRLTAARDGVRYVMETPDGLVPSDAGAPVIVRAVGTSRFVWYDTAIAAALKWAR